MRVRIASTCARTRAGCRDLGSICGALRPQSARCRPARLPIKPGRGYHEDRHTRGSHVDQRARRSTSRAVKGLALQQPQPQPCDGQRSSSQPRDNPKLLTLFTPFRPSWEPSPRSGTRAVRATDTERPTSAPVHHRVGGYVCRCGLARLEAPRGMRRSADNLRPMAWVA